MIYIVGGIIVLVIAVAAVSDLVASGKRNGPDARTTELGKKPGFLRGLFTSEKKRAGNRGEAEAVKIIQSVLRGDDRLFTHFRITSHGKRSEMDNVIVNRYGVFIIEVKDWNGEIAGGADDPEWKQYKTTYEGRTYENVRKNPIRQVNGQIYALKEYLNAHGVSVWVDGYVMMLRGNSPIRSARMLNGPTDIDRAIHTPGRITLDAKTAETIKKLLMKKDPPRPPPKRCNRHKTDRTTKRRPRRTAISGGISCTIFPSENSRCPAAATIWRAGRI